MKNQKPSRKTYSANRGSLHAVVRPRPNNLAATVFVFESTRKPYQTHVVYLDQASCYVDHQGWKHTATLEPAVWIEHLMNNPAEREKQIESLCFRPNEKLCNSPGSGASPKEKTL